MFLYLEKFEEILTVQDSPRSPGPRGQTKALYGGDGHALSHEPNIPHPSLRQSSTIFGVGSHRPAPVFTYELDNRFRKDPPANFAEINMPSDSNHNPKPPNFLEPESQPSFNQVQFQESAANSRSTLLVLEGAALPQRNYVDWSTVQPQFQSHRRTPSEYTDVSVSSASLRVRR
jgi:hypothetical protein